MQILALETTGKYGSAAVISDDGKLSYAVSAGEMNHLTDIISLVDKCLADSGIGKSELTQIAASVGPGSFTGIRIGVSTARALTQSLEIPCVAVSSLEGMAVLATMSTAYAEISQGGAPLICTIINARRHQVYGAIWRGGAAVAEERQYMIEEILDILANCDADRILFSGDGIDAYKDIIESRVAEDSAFKDKKIAFVEEECRYQRADTIAQLALSKFSDDAAGQCELISYDKLLPVYMRKSEAEMRLEAGTLSDKISAK